LYITYTISPAYDPVDSKPGQTIKKTRIGIVGAPDETAEITDAVAKVALARFICATPVYYYGLRGTQYDFELMGTDSQLDTVLILLGATQTGIYEARKAIKDLNAQRTAQSK